MEWLITFVKFYIIWAMKWKLGFTIMWRWSLRLEFISSAQTRVLNWLQNTSKLISIADIYPIVLLYKIPYLNNRVIHLVSTGLTWLTCKEVRLARGVWLTVQLTEPVSKDHLSEHCALSTAHTMSEQSDAEAYHKTLHASNRGCLCKYGCVQTKNKLYFRI